jgi:GTPase SAR1 family protein
MQCWLRPPLTRRDCFDDALPARSNNMTPRIPEEFSTRLIDWSPFVIMGNKIPPRDHPDEDEEDEEEEDRADEPPVVREPDED